VTTSRREFLKLAAAAAFPVRDGVPRVDYHAHMEQGMTVERALALSKELKVKFGLVAHAGKRDGSSAADLVSDDGGLNKWIGSLEGKPVFKGIQAEHINWMGAFSREMVAKLDYVLSDALTVPARGGGLQKIWMPEFRCDDPQEFMDRYVDFHVEVMAKEPIDIIANTTFLPEMMQKDFDTLWTDKRMRTVVDAAKRYGVAVEINSRYRVPRLPFLEMAKGAGLKFSFGSNMHTADGIGHIDYCVEMYRRAGLTVEQFFEPAPFGKKPIQIRSLA
jgi:histidinol phosphatase-like PHP family hydrolase